MTSKGLFCLFNGELLPKEKIMVNVTDLAMVRGYGVFDFLRTYNRKPFRINDYLTRFENSCNEMNLAVPSRQEIIRQVETLISKNTGIGELGIRFLVSGGESEDGYTIVKPSFFILVEHLPQYPNWQFTDGISLQTWEHQRELPKVKTINYLTAIKLSPERHLLKVQDTLYYSQGKVLECTRNNFFLFHGDVLVTASNGMLEGITRKTVLELSDGLFDLEIREVKKEELYECTECFISGSTRGVCPVAKIDEQIIGNGKPGTNTQELMSRWAELTRQY
jgi:branched-chain amino acid aminotransferase